MKTDQSTAGGLWVAGNRQKKRDEEAELIKETGGTGSRYRLFESDGLGPARGIAIGMLFGVACWATLFMVIYFIFFEEPVELPRASVVAVETVGSPPTSSAGGHR